LSFFNIMKAILIKEPGGAEQLELGTFPTPEPADDELLVKVKAAALNRADIMQREGNYPPPKGASPILGLEMAGVVEEVGEKCSIWKPGDRVFALLPGGGYAEYATVPEAMAIPIPENLDFVQAAAIPEVFLTAYQCLFWIGRLQQNETVLIHAGASGVGTAAIQLARETGARIIVTAGAERKLTACQDLGADVAINYKEGPFVPKVLEATDNRGVDLVLDFVGASYWEQNLSALAIDGRWVLIALLGGAKVAQVNLGLLIRKRIQFTATSLRTRSVGYKIRLTRDFADFALPRFADGRLKPVIDKVLSWEQAVEAHQYMEANKNIGKIVLSV
jgi:putative PIG3 family NAD(P)H quinone oxidoreductase